MIFWDTDLGTDVYDEIEKLPNYLTSWPMPEGFTIDDILGDLEEAIESEGLKYVRQEYGKGFVEHTIVDGDLGGPTVAKINSGFDGQLLGLEQQNSEYAEQFRRICYWMNDYMEALSRVDREY